jgi:hypothetical protein
MFRRAAGPVLVVLAVAVFGSGVAQAAPKPVFTVSAGPASVAAGSSGNAIAFNFVATDSVQTSVSIVVPAVASGSPWTAPQAANAAGAGYVAAAAQTCNAAQVSSVTGPAAGPWTILVDAKCSKGKTFTVTYGGGSGAKVTAATRAGAYTFTTMAKAGGSFLPVTTQPVVTVTPGPATSLAVSGLVDAVASTLQSPTVTARDQFGNTAPSYRGTVHFSVSGPLVAFNQPNELYPGYDRNKNYRELPADYTFTAADGGTHTFASSLRIMAAGNQTLTAADTATTTIKGTQTVAISHDTFIDIDVLSPTAPKSAYLNLLVPRTRLTVAAFDAWGNIATDTSGTVNMSYAVDGGGTPGVLPSQLTLLGGTASADITWPTNDSGDIIVLMRGQMGGGVFPKSFTRPFEQHVLTPPTLEALVIPIPPQNVGDPQTYSLSLPSENLVLPPDTLRITAVQPSPIILGSILITLEGQTVVGDPSTAVAMTVTLGTPLYLDTGYMESDPFFAPAPQMPIEVSPIDLLPSSSFKDVGTINPNTATVTYTEPNTGSTMMVQAYNISTPSCVETGLVWDPDLGKCMPIVEP